jgi:hypothetical protein
LVSDKQLSTSSSDGGAATVPSSTDPLHPYASLIASSAPSFASAFSSLSSTLSSSSSAATYPPSSPSSVTTTNNNRQQHAKKHPSSSVEQQHKIFPNSHGARIESNDERLAKIGGRTVTDDETDELEQPQLPQRQQQSQICPSTNQPLRKNGELVSCNGMAPTCPPRSYCYVTGLASENYFCCISW